MKKPTFLVHYNSQTNRNPSKLLIVADCKLPLEFINVLCDRLNTNADLLYIDSSRKTRKKVLARHSSYLILANKALLIGHNYENIIFWQQFIGLYWGFFSFLRRRKKSKAFLLPLIYKSRKGIKGKIHRLFFNLSLSNSSLLGAICYSSQELKYYKRIFSKCKNKIFFVPYGQTSEVKASRNYSISMENPYFFSGGTSNRDYSTFMLVASKMTKCDFIVACTPEDIMGIDVPSNVRAFYDAYGDKFDLLMKCSYAVVLILKKSNISSGQIVLLKAMEMGKPIIATRSVGIIDYIDDSCAFIVPSKNLEKLQNILNFVIENPKETQLRARNAKKRHKEKYTIQRLAFSLAELIINKNRI